MSKKFSGISLIELLIVISIISILFTLTIVVINPINLLNKANDSRRITDLGKLVLAIEEYKSNNKQYPGENNIIYKSNDKENILAVKANNGWILSDLSFFISKLPVDPINSGEYVYRYTKNDDFFEVDATLINLVDRNQNDNGNNIFRFELGTDLSLLN